MVIAAVWAGWGIAEWLDESTSREAGPAIYLAWPVLVVASTLLTIRFAKTLVVPMAAVGALILWLTCLRGFLIYWPYFPTAIFLTGYLSAEWLKTSRSLR